jgi:hypothetical protein
VWRATNKGNFCQPARGPGRSVPVGGKTFWKRGKQAHLHPEFCGEVWLEWHSRRRFRQEQRGDTSFFRTSIEHFWNTICIHLTV